MIFKKSSTRSNFFFANSPRTSAGLRRRTYLAKLSIYAIINTCQHLEPIQVSEQKFLSLGNHSGLCTMGRIPPLPPERAMGHARSRRANTRTATNRSNASLCLWTAKRRATKPLRDHAVHVYSRVGKMGKQSLILHNKKSAANTTLHSIRSLLQNQLVENEEKLKTAAEYWRNMTDDKNQN